MYCTKCGSQVLAGAKFCTACGTPVGVQPQPVVPPLQPVTAQPKVDYTRKFRTGKVITIIAIAALAILVFAVVGIFAAGSEGGKLVISITNLLLGLLFSLDVLAMFAGIILGIVFVSKASGETGDRKSYYHRIALWWFVGPIVICFGIILLYVIINVIEHLVLKS